MKVSSAAGFISTRPLHTTTAANRLRLGVPTAYVAVVCLFLWFIAGFHVPGQGFTYLVMFGANASARYVPEIKAQPHYEIPRSIGYDGAYYAQLAIRPSLADPDLREAIDNLPYRARRMLFCWTAYVLGGGQPTAVLQVYAAQNIVAWCALAALLLLWFPAHRWDNFVRWCGVLFSAGLCFSLRAALMDGPSLLVIAGAAALIERGRPRTGCALLALSGLAKETNLLGAPLLGPADGSRSARLRFLRQAVVIMTPLVLWMISLRFWLGESTAYKGGNFGLPFVAFIAKWREVIGQLVAEDPAVTARANLCVLIGLTAQASFFLLRPRWSDRWWRLGVAYAALLVILGPAVWAGHPIAAARVLLPMTLAFNIALPRSRSWWLILLLGNLAVFASPRLLDRPAAETCAITGALSSAQPRVSVIHDGNWYEPERSLLERWNWSKGDAGIAVRNPHPFAIRAHVRFVLRTAMARQICIEWAGHEVGREQLADRGQADVVLRDVVLRPGNTTLWFKTDARASRPRASDPRAVAFNVRNLELQLVEEVPPTGDRAGK